MVQIEYGIKDNEEVGLFSPYTVWAQCAGVNI